MQSVSYTATYWRTDGTVWSPGWCGSERMWFWYYLLLVLERIAQTDTQQRLRLHVDVLRPVVVELECQRCGDEFCCLDFNRIFPAHRRMD